MSYLVIGGGAAALDRVAGPSSAIKERVFVISTLAGDFVSMASTVCSGGDALVC